jgi:hypothetical protein
MEETEKAADGAKAAAISPDDSLPSVDRTWQEMAQISPLHVINDVPMHHDYGFLEAERMVRAHPVPSTATSRCDRSISTLCWKMHMQRMLPTDRVACCGL